MNQNNLFHILTKSFWPIALGSAATAVMFSTAMWFRSGLSASALYGFLSVFIFFVFWTTDIFGESMTGNHSSNVIDGMKYGMVLFIFSEVMFFFGFFWVFFDTVMVPSVSLGNLLNPLGVELLNPFGVPLLNTILLLASGAVCTVSHYRLVNNKSQALLFLFITTLLGAYFSYFQALEYSGGSFSMSDTSFGAIFYTITGFHGAHVLIGTSFIVSFFSRFSLLQVDSVRHTGVELAIWYWHFVDVVWLFLYIFVYTWVSVK